jgi:6-phosphofructokinase
LYWQGGALFGTKRTLPTSDKELSACAENLGKFGIQGLVCLGGKFSQLMWFLF